MPVVAGQNRLVKNGAHPAQEGLSPALPADVVHLAAGLLVGVEAKVEAFALAAERRLRDARVGGKVDARRPGHRPIQGGLRVGQRVLCGGHLVVWFVVVDPLDVVVVVVAVVHLLLLLDGLLFGLGLSAFGASGVLGRHSRRLLLLLTELAGWRLRGRHLLLLDVINVVDVVVAVGLL